MIYILFFFLFITAFGVGFFYGLKYSSNEIVHIKNCSDKYLDQLKLAVRWIKEPTKIMKYLETHKYKKVCIYGMSYFGDCLVRYLRGNDEIVVVCGIDRNVEHVYSPEIPVYGSLDGNFMNVDVIIVTSIISYPEIEKELKEKTKVDIVSLEDVLYG